MTNRCKCGRKMSKYATRCKECERKRNALMKAQNQQVLSNGKCPKCGSGLKRNSSLTGWWQCEQYGAATHRARPNDPACLFQMFV